MSEVLLKLEGVSKFFTGVKALNKVDFTLRQGEVHALMGENGAGKSTLIKVMTGIYEKNEGIIRLGSQQEEVEINHPKVAQHLGIQTVYQEITLLPNVTVAENLFSGREPKKFGLIDWKRMNELAQALLQKFEIKVAPTTQLDECSIATQQMIAIARALDMDCKVLILDEPTSSLDDEEVSKLFAVIRNLKEKGVGIIFVTHFLEQVYAVSDRITVLRNGELVGEYFISELPRRELVAKMMGKEFDDLADIKETGKKVGDKTATHHTFLRANQLSSDVLTKPFDFDISQGEVVGISGLLGSGRSELVRTLYGEQTILSGDIEINHQKTTIKHSLDAMTAGMAYLSEDRKNEGIFADLSVRENIIIALQSKRGLFKKLSQKEMDEFADRYIELLQIKTASRETPIKQLSGGNQQKAIIGRWLLTQPQLLILDEPTRGIDVGTKTEIQKLVLKLAKDGMSVIFISSEIEEMLRTCSRLVVMRDRVKVGELAEDHLNESMVIQTIAGGDVDHDN